MILEKIGKIRNQNLEELHYWCQQHRSLLKPTVSSYARGRQELWIRRYCDLRKQPRITEGYRNDRLEALGEQILPKFDIGLVLLYQSGVKIGLHRDHTVFQPVGVNINLGEVFFLIAPRPRKGEKLQLQRHHLRDGDVIRFNTKLLHGTEPVTSERWCIIFWHLKDVYLKDTANKDSNLLATLASHSAYRY